MYAIFSNFFLDGSSTVKKNRTRPKSPSVPAFKFGSKYLTTEAHRVEFVAANSSDITWKLASGSWSLKVQVFQRTKSFGISGWWATASDSAVSVRRIKSFSNLLSYAVNRDVFLTPPNLTVPSVSLSLRGESGSNLRSLQKNLCSKAVRLGGSARIGSINSYCRCSGSGGAAAMALRAACSGILNTRSHTPMQQDPTIVILIEQFIQIIIAICSWPTVVCVEMDIRYHMSLFVKHGGNGHGSVGCEMISGSACHHPTKPFHRPLRVTIHWAVPLDSIGDMEKLVEHRETRSKPIPFMAVIPLLIVFDEIYKEYLNCRIENVSCTVLVE